VGWTTGVYNMKQVDKKILVGTLNYLNILMREYGEEALVTDVIDVELQK
jgi:hypothetical protein